MQENTVGSLSAEERLLARLTLVCVRLLLAVCLNLDARFD